jgi:hypothetical protein
MLDPRKAGELMQRHFDTVTDEEFIANVRRSSPDLAREMWGDLTTVEILARRPHAATVGESLRAFDSPVIGYPGTEIARASREPAPRGMDAAPVVPQAPSFSRIVRGVFASLSRSVLRLFS